MKLKLLFAAVLIWGVNPFSFAMEQEAPGQFEVKEKDAHTLDQLVTFICNKQEEINRYSFVGNWAMQTASKKLGYGSVDVFDIKIVQEKFPQKKCLIQNLLKEYDIKINMEFSDDRISQWQKLKRAAVVENLKEYSAQQFNVEKEVATKTLYDKFDSQKKKVLSIMAQNFHDLQRFIQEIENKESFLSGWW